MYRLYSIHRTSQVRVRPACLGAGVLSALLLFAISPALAVSSRTLITVTGEATSNFFGHAVSSAGDVNGDGYADVIVGAHYYEPGTGRGRAYLYYGGPGSDNVADLTMTGQAASDEFGYSVSSAGDMNGDGYADVIVGAIAAPGNNTGRAYVFYGGPAADNVADLTLSGAAVNNFFGNSVSSAGGSGFARVSVFDVAGRLVRTVANGQYPAGYQSAIWDGRDTRGRTVAAGLYFLRAESAREQRTLKIVTTR
jgi:FG-GAP repeat/FlgD Ig-like domain